MSPSPGNGRLHASPSPSPGPSHRSSNTLRSSGSRESGEGGSRSANGPGTLDLTSIRHKANDGPLGVSDAGEDLLPVRGHGSGRRRRPKSSGGFLLDDAFDKRAEQSSPRENNRPVSRQGHSPASGGSVKGKEKAIHLGANGTVRRPAGRLDRSASPMNVRQNGSSPAGGSRPSQDTPRISIETSDDSPSSWMQDGRLSSEQDDGRWHQPVAQPNAVDSAQLVQMALALSEGRRRHVSGAHLTPPTSNIGRRTTSAGMAAVQGGYNGLNAGGSLKRYLNEQRRISGNVSPTQGRNTPPGRHVSTAFNGVGALDLGSGQPRLNVSDGTLARVDKARGYIEMRSHYMRLLDYLPPLKPDAKANGNTIVQTSSLPGGAVQMRRMQSYRNTRHELGRQYNPLQVVRDRKLRARMRKPCNPEAERWTDVDSVIDWVDDVEVTAKHSGYREDDRVHLPRFLDGEYDRHATSGHARVESGTAGKTKKTRTDWHVNPEELFADAYWLEQGGNKGLVEDRHGNVLFPGYAATHKQQTRSPSEERQLPTPPDDRERARSTLAAESAESTDVDSPEPVQHRGRRRLFHRHREQSPGTLRQLWQKRKERSPSSDGLSETDDEFTDGRPGTKRRIPNPEHEVNIGPLERHMNSIVEKLDQTGSPELASPGTPEKWGAQRDLTKAQVREAAEDADSSRTPEHTPPRVLVHGERADRKRPFPSLETAFDSSLDDTAPNSPVAKKAPSFNLEDAPSRDSSRAPEHKRRIPFLHHHHKGKDNSRLAPQDPYVADESDARSSRQPSAETDPVRTSLEDKQRSSTQNLSLWRTNDSFASTATSRKDGSDREPGSAVSRFFKGGRVGDLLRREAPDFMWKKEPLPEEAIPSSRSSNYESESGGEESASRARSGQMQGLSKTSTNSSWASRALDRRNANKPRYHVDGLPTFKSSQTPSTSTLQSTIDKAKPSRFNLLHPIRTETSSLSRSTTREQGPASAAPTDTYTGTSSIEDRRGSYGFLNPKYHSRNGPAQANGRLAAVPDGRALTQDGNLSVHPLRASSSRGTSASPSRAQLLDGHRHWSISDPSSLARQRSRSAAGGRSTSRTSHPLHPSANVVSKVEMERVRALLLCTGIKALTMSYRASEVRPPEQLHPLLHAVSRNTGKPLVPVARKQEHILAARMLVDDFDGSVEGLRGLADEFSARRAAELAGALERLKEVARDELTERSRALGDEAAGIAIHVTTKGTRDVQTLSEAAQAVARARRRRMRWVRRMGWGMVEWMLLGIMWWVWLVVMVVRVVLRVFGGVGYAVKWLLFL